MRIALLQSDLVWEDTRENQLSFSRQINQLKEVDLIVLPEMFSSGFTMNPKPVAQGMDGETVTWMTESARLANAAICGSLVIADGGKFYNRLIFAMPTGEIQYYDKRHLFTLAGEHNAYTPGTEKIIVDFKGFRICPLICYDLRFPVFSRNNDDYDLLIYVANWPQPRVAAWDTLLRARAIENMSFVIGVNRVGKDNNGHNYVGHSQAIDAFGNTLTPFSEVRGAIFTELNKATLLEARQKFGFLNDRDRFTVI